MPSGLLQKCLADLHAARFLATTETERKALQGAIAEVVDGLFASGEMPGAAALNSKELAPAQSAERPMSRHSPFYGLGLKEVCPKLLSLAGNAGNKTPQTPREIWEQLKADGFILNHHDPVHAVNDALRRRAKTHGDVLLVGGGKWGKTEWYSEAQLEEIRKSMGGMGGRDRGDHIERTKAGMMTAKWRGARLGAEKKLSAEQITQIEEMVRAGAKIHEIAKRFEVSPGTINNQFRWGRASKSLGELREEGKKLRAVAMDPSTDSGPDGTRH
jgi:hypothetical protein